MVIIFISIVTCNISIFFKCEMFVIPSAYATTQTVARTLIDRKCHAAAPSTSFRRKHVSACSSALRACCFPALSCHCCCHLVRAMLGSVLVVLYHAPWGPFLSEPGAYRIRTAPPARPYPHVTCPSRVLYNKPFFQLDYCGAINHLLQEERLYFTIGCTIIPFHFI